MDGLRLRHHIAQAHAGGEDFGEAVGHHHVAHGVKALDGGQVLAAVADVAVGVVLQHQHVVLGGQLGHLLPALQAQGPSAGILEGGDHVHHLGVILLDLRLQVVHLHAVLVHIHADALGLEHLKDLHGVHEGGGLHQDHVAGIDIHLAHQVDALQAAGHHHYIICSAFHALGCQQLVDDDFLHVLGAADGAILQSFHAALVLQDDLVRQLTQDVDGQGLLSRGAAAEGNNVGIGHRTEKIADHVGSVSHCAHALCILYHLIAPPSFHCRSPPAFAWVCHHCSTLSGKRKCKVFTYPLKIVQHTFMNFVLI